MYNFVVFRVISMLIGYCFGNIPFGLIFAKLHHVDIRNTGSGNVGSTNVARSVGFKTGLLTLLCDCLKAVIPALFVLLFFISVPNFPIEVAKLLSVYTAFGAVMGHIFPVVLKFKGGKGIATSAGLIIIAAPWTLVSCLIAFLLVVITTRYVSLGSLSCGIVLPVHVCILACTGTLGYPDVIAFEVAILFIVDAIVCVFRHKDNIKRLINGTESKFTFKK